MEPWILVAIGVFIGLAVSYIIRLIFYIYYDDDEQVVKSELCNDSKPSRCSKKEPCFCCRSATVLFFPDKAFPCNSFYNTLMGERNKRCFREKCDYLHGKPNEPHSSLMEIFETLNKARKRIDLCMYLITSEKLASFLIYLKQREGILVRIITDWGGDENNRINNQIPNLKNSGIEVKTNSQTGKGALMHNKFVVVDNKTLIVGSFNWTKNAILKNDEAIIITSQQLIVREFAFKFDEMWKLL